MNFGCSDRMCGAIDCPSCFPEVASWSDVTCTECKEPLLYCKCEDITEDDFEDDDSYDEDEDEEDEDADRDIDAARN